MPGMNESCCLYRRKLVVTIAAVLPEEVCGVGDAYLADLLRFDLETPTNHPVIAFRFCPWCGKPFEPTSEIRIADPQEDPPA